MDSFIFEFFQGYENFFPEKWQFYDIFAHSNNIKPPEDLTQTQKKEKTSLCNGKIFSNFRPTRTEIFLGA